jgi:hypothetical protein
MISSLQQEARTGLKSTQEGPRRYGDHANLYKYIKSFLMLEYNKVAQIQHAVKSWNNYFCQRNRASPFTSVPLFSPAAADTYCDIKVCKDSSCNN